MSSGGGTRTTPRRGRAAHRGRQRQARGARRRPRSSCGGPGTARAGRATYRVRPAGLPRRGRRRLGARPADRAARVQRRRRRRGGDLAGGHAVLPGPDRRGARAGGAVPRHDDAAVRDRRAADRAVPRPVQPRPPLGDRRDDGDPGVPVLGAGRRGRQRVDRGCSRPRSACWSRPRRTASRKAAAAPRLVPDGITLVKANARISLAGVVGAALSAPLAALAATFGAEWSLRYGFLVFVVATILAILLPRTGRLRAGRGALELASDQQPPRLREAQAARPADPGHRRLRAAGQLRPTLPVRLPDHVHGVPAAGEPDRRLGGQARAAARRRDRRRRASATPSASRSRRCSNRSTLPSRWWSRCSRTLR